MKFPVSSYALLVISFLVVCLIVPASQAQTPDAAISGVVEDNSGAVIPNATVTIVSKEQGFRRVVKTNGDGLFNAPALISGRYQVTVQAKGFQTTVLDGLKLDVAATANYEFKLKVGSQDQTVTVSAGGPTINTTDASVSTVIDQQLISELPLNGRSLDTLFLLTPGVVSSGTQNAGGQYSVNGQRSSGNYLTVDGTSGNIYVGANAVGGLFGTAQTGLAGSTYATSASGGTNGLLPVDAIEEYRMQTSTYSAEYGRSPGGQIQIRTRGGTNEFHGSGFEYFRNQVMDAIDWFVKYDGLKQAPLRMNDFGGTLGGPILKNRLFFFAAHETLFLDQPNNVSFGVPSALARQQTGSAFTPFVTAFPKGGGVDTTAQYPLYSDIYNAEYATQIVDHSTSARFDASLPRGYKAFFRVNVAPSHTTTTTWQSTVTNTNINTYTAGVTKNLTPAIINDLTWNYSQDTANWTYGIQPIGGANPSGLGAYCSTLVTGSSPAFCLIQGLYDWTAAELGSVIAATSTQNNVIDTLRWSVKRHQLAFGADFRRLPTQVAGKFLVQLYIASNTSPASLAGDTFDNVNVSGPNVGTITLPVDNLSLFAQDDWRINNRLTLNYGLRWEYNPPISDGHGGPLALIGSVNDLAGLEAAPTYTPLYKTTYANFAPRVCY